MGVHETAGVMFQPLARFYYNCMDTDGNGTIDADEFKAWFPKVLAFREMWRRCAEVRQEYPLDLGAVGGDAASTTTAAAATDAGIGAGAGDGPGGVGAAATQPTSAAAFRNRTKVTQQQTSALIRVALAQHKPLAADGEQLDDAIADALGDALMVAAEEDDVATIARVFAQCGDVDIEFACGIVIEEQQWLSANDGNIVTAHRY